MAASPRPAKKSGKRHPWKDDHVLPIIYDDVYKYDSELSVYIHDHEDVHVSRPHLSDEQEW
jgi:hypothetical protein